MGAYDDAMATLREARDALNALELAAAADALARHDEVVREALAAVPPRLAASEGEAIADAHRTLLDQMRAVQRGVVDGLQQTRRGATAARAYLGAAGA